MKCPSCNSKVKNNSDYSTHMNTKHRGQSYKLLSAKNTSVKNDYGKTDVETKVEE